MKTHWPGFSGRNAVLLRAYKMADQNKDGFIEQNEFSRFMYFLAIFSDLDLEFQGMDADNDHRIDRDEFVAFYRKIGSRDSDQQLQDKFDEIDSNGRGLILFDEFCEHFATALKDTRNTSEPQQNSNNRVASPPPQVQGNTPAVAQNNTSTVKNATLAHEKQVKPQVAENKGFFQDMSESIARVSRNVAAKFSESNQSQQSQQQPQPQPKFANVQLSPDLKKTQTPATRNHLQPWDRPAALESQRAPQQKPTTQYQLAPLSPQNRRHESPLINEKLTMERFSAAEPIVRSIIEPPPTTVGKNLAHQSEVQSLRKQLMHEQYERKRLDATVEALKNQIYSMGGRVDDGRVLKSRAGVESVTNLNQHLQDRLENEQRKYRMLEQDLMRANERIRTLELEGRRDYFEETRRSQSLNVQQMHRDIRQERQERMKFENLFDETSRRLAVEQERNRRLNEELTSLKTFIRYQDRVKPV